MLNSSEKYFPIVERLLVSGLSAKAFSEQTGINTHTLSYWKKRYRNQDKPKAKGFATLSIADIAANQISIEYADGTRLTFTGATDVLLLKQFIPALSQ